MTSYALSIVVDGPGLDTKNRSHWTFAIHEEDATTGTVLQVQVIDLESLIYQYDERSGVDILNRSSEGSFKMVTMTREQARQATQIIREEPAPMDGVERCQDWVLRATISLEAAEVVPPGTSTWIEGLVGQAASTVAQITGDRWMKTKTLESNIEA